ncbi:hybrid sensor histidine kinase/response regulator transcription factor [Cryomorphaceae bacterium 1068]|nr:hybrid sensor histidine kinase/response regulator transcription factor [Cryomorphaceae bacterium 1068]
MEVRWLCLSFWCFLSAALSMMAQNDVPLDTESKKSESGLPFIEYYSPERYDALTQNWGAVQDSLGMLYFANGGGVLIYNGVTWELIELPNKTHTKCIAIDNKSRVYVGAFGEFGFIEPDELGQFQYVSLSDSLQESDRDFSTIWTVLAADDGIYFRSTEAIFRWDNEKLKVWKSEENEFRFSFVVRGKFYVMHNSQGMMSMGNDDLELIPNGEFYVKKGVTVMLPYPPNKLLVGTLKGFYIHDENEIVPFYNEVEDYLVESFPYGGIVLNDGTFAIATLNAGLVVIDNEGKLKLLLNDNEYLGSLEVYNLFQDKSGILWASLGKGIAKIEYPSPFTCFEHLNGNFRAFALTRYKGKLYAGTDIGLFVLETDKSGKAQFEGVLDMNKRIWDLHVFEDRLMVGGTGGIYEIKDNEVSRIPTENISKFRRSPLDDNRIFLTMARGFESIYFKEGEWIREGPVADIDVDTYTVLVDSSGNIWLETSEDWLWRVRFENRGEARDLENPILKKYGLENGLSVERTQLLMVNGVIYSTPHEAGKTSFSYDPGTDRFAEDTLLQALFFNKPGPIRLNHVDTLENVLFTTFDDDGFSNNYIAWKQADNQYEVEELHEHRIAGQDQIAAFVDLEDSVIWYGGNDGVYRHDLKQKKIDNNGGLALINKVLYDTDSLLISGPYQRTSISLPHSNKMLRVAYSSTGYYDENSHLYQYQLEGFEDSWSAWTVETQKDYTNLSEGNYTFRVRSKDIFGQVSAGSNFAFVILPPWHRTWWAYLLYILLAIVVFVSLNYWRTRQLRQKNLDLEAIVLDRTEAMVVKNAELEEKTEKLRAQTDQLKELDRMKTRLFANISHEFRTPLTLIKGPIELAERSPEKPMPPENVKMVRRNANRLLKLVNQLLDLSKIDAGGLKLEPTEGNTFKCLRAAASSFSSHAAQRNMDYQIRIPSTTLWASFDRDKLEKVAYNLLSNAFKFTSDNGTVVFSASYAGGQLRIEVKDTGHGIPAERLQKIFDRFYQVDDSFTKEKEGTGIGLALTKELVDIMIGEIFVESEIGQGTFFKVIIPLEEIIPSKRETEADYSFHEHDFKGSARSPEPDQSIAHKTVLIIEDHIDMRDFIRQQLEDEYQIIEAFNGQDGLEKANKQTPDLIITDLMMPQIDGITLCKELKLNIHTSHIPVIMLTAKAGIENKIEGLETGADDYLTKPFNTLELQVRVKNLIQQRENLRDLFTKSNFVHPKEVTVNSMDEQFLQKTLDLFEEKYADSDFGIAEMQESLAMSKAQLHRKFKAITSQTPGELLRNFRLKRAAQILEQDGENVTQVAYAVGFNNLSYFAKCFKSLFGVTPSAYAKKTK